MKKFAFCSSTILTIVIWISILRNCVTIHVEHQREIPNMERPKRMIILPKGTVIQLVYCYLMSALGADGIFTVGVTLGLNWDVPTDVLELDSRLREHKIFTSRKDRRSFYSAFKNAVEKLEGDSLSLLKGMLCYTKEKATIESGNRSFILEIIHMIFLYPSPSKSTMEPNDVYDWMLQQCHDRSIRNDELVSLLEY